MTRTTIDFGIDLGTTNSEIAVLKGTQPEIIENNEGMKHTPSSVWIDKNDRLFIGQRAKDRVESDPENAFFEFKRLMGTDQEYCFQASGRRMKPEELSAEVLKSLKADVQQRLGEDLQVAVITVPAAFELPQNEATQKAARLAGIHVSPLIMEPTAAAMAYGFQSTSDNVFWLVYDLGGGTFDACLIQLRDGQFQIVNHKGDNYLGGKNLDWKIVEELFVPKILKNLKLEDFQRGNPYWRGVFAKLKIAAEEAKIQLSRDSVYQICSDDLFRYSRKDVNYDFEFELSRETVAQLAIPLIQRTINIGREVLSEAHLSPADVEKLILVGGPTLAPYVRSMLSDETEGLQIPLEFKIDPFTVVAQGAAIFSGTQRLEIPTKVRKDPEEFTVELEYQPIGSDEDPYIGGKLVPPDGRSLDGFTMEISCPTWKSGRLKVQTNGAFMTTIHAERGIQNSYRLSLFDATGQTLHLTPDSMTYIIGNAPTDPLLLNSMAVALANNEVVIFLQKGSVLPARHTEVLKTAKTVRKGSEGEFICVPVLEGENPKADRNKLNGILEIKGVNIRRDVPAGSDIEVTVVMDKSRILTARAFIPILDEEFEQVIDLKKESVDPKRLEREFVLEKDRLIKIQEDAERAEDDRVNQGLELIGDEKKVPELERQVSAAVGDKDAAMEAQNRLLELRIALDQIEERLKWPALVTEAEEQIQNTAELNQQYGTSETKSAAAALEKDIRQAILAKEPDLLRRKIDDLSSVGYAILSERPEWWVGFFSYIQENNRASMTDPTQANKLFTEGERAINNGDLPKLKLVVRQLLNLLPEGERQAISMGYGSTLTR